MLMLPLYLLRTYLSGVDFHAKKERCVRFCQRRCVWLAGRRLARMCIYPSLSMSICSCYILLHTMTVMCHESILEPLGQHAFSGFGLVGSLI